MKTEIIRILREQKGEFVSGEMLCEQFSVSRNAVWKAINRLKEQGFEIESVTKKGYRLISEPDLLAKESIESYLSREASVFCFDEIDSTNNECMRLAGNGAPDGTLVAADCQTGGKGRRGRNWTTPKGTAVAMSILLRPQIAPQNAPILTLVSALAVAKALQENGVKEGLGIKWPNDLVLNKKKICGILTEMITEVDYINHIVVGIGINTHVESFPEEIKDIASSILLETGIKINRSKLIADVYNCFFRYYDIFLKTEDLSGLKEEYDGLLLNKDKEVKVLDPKGEFCGTALGINERGELKVKLSDGGVTEVSAGEVSVRGLYGYVL
ncbi:MAG: biotin--[acetyl-CoA-carboxylase] ligase [Lachnospiraceae bacterium]|nr:biotin--[acetyl-CoA-carboxylase] ligase [Lachnospiraceae bacterium]